MKRPQSPSSPRAPYSLLTATRGALVGATLLAGACATEAGPEAPALRFAPVGVCTATGNGDDRLPDDIDRVVVELSGGSRPAPLYSQLPVSAATAQGELVFQGLPVGEGMRLRVAGCSGTTAKWAGEARGVDVGEFDKTFPEIYLTPIGRLACAGNATSPEASRRLSEPRGFAALAAGEGEAWIVGGAKRLVTTPLPAIEGTGTIDRFDPVSGELAQVGSLATARVGALARPVGAGRVRVIGGASRIQLAAAGKPPIWADPNDAPAIGSEVFDLATKSATAELESPLPALASLGAVGSGAVVAVGGTSTVGNYSDALTIVRGAEADTARLGVGRFGAVVVGLDANRALVWGGNVDGTPDATGLIVDTSVPAASAVSELEITGAGVVAFFPAAAVLSTSGDTVRVVIAGGGNINANGTFPTKIDSSRVELVTIDLGAMTAEVEALGLGDFGPGAFARAGSQLLALAGGELAFFGGYTAFSQSSFCSSPDDCIQPTLLRFRVGEGEITQTAQPVELTVGPLGAAAAGLEDGAWLLTGGVESVKQTTLGRDASLMRFGAFDPDPCAQPVATP